MPLSTNLKTMAEKIRIKDIAERAGVSVGTVDRVLHDRPNVSKPAREKVERALKEMNYQPNMYASALAYNKEYTFYLLLPKHESEAYWEEIEEGARKCEDQRRDFHINLEIKFYERSNEKEVMLMRQTKDGQVMSKQQDNREVGFRHYMHDHFPQMQIYTLDLPLNGTRNEFVKMLEKYFAEHSDTHHCITMTSKAHIVGDYLLKSNRRDIQIMGYDMVEKNARCLREGSISFLIAQHAFMQGYYCVDTLFQAIVLKKKVNPVNYMPIELLMKENVDFYRRTQI